MSSSALSSMSIDVLSSAAQLHGTCVKLAQHLHGTQYLQRMLQQAPSVLNKGLEVLC